MQPFTESSSMVGGDAIDRKRKIQGEEPVDRARLSCECRHVQCTHESRRS